MTMRKAFLTYTGIDLTAVQQPDLFRKAADNLGPGISANDDWETVFNKVFLTFIEPELPKDKPVFITHYPVQIPCLAKKIPDSPWRERWELYLNGIECANCFTEERDFNELNTFYAHEAARMDTRRTSAQADTGFLNLFRDGGFPFCSGVALGMDRLLMLLTGRKDIRGVILFPFFDMLSTYS
jgi:lysyl-tRNA synthetase class 2